MTPEVLTKVFGRPDTSSRVLQPQCNQVCGRGTYGTDHLRPLTVDARSICYDWNIPPNIKNLRQSELVALSSKGSNQHTKRFPYIVALEARQINMNSLIYIAHYVWDVVNATFATGLAIFPTNLSTLWLNLHLFLRERPYGMAGRLTKNNFQLTLSSCSGQSNQHTLNVSIQCRAPHLWKIY